MTLRKPKAVIFDWDDTIVDSWPTAMKALNAALTGMGMEAWTNEEAKRRCGGSARDLFESLFGDRWVDADKIYYDTFLRLNKTELRLHDHVEDILKFLFQNDVYLAVVSNKRGPLLRDEAAHVKFESYFKKIVGAGDAAADKPDPVVIDLALDGSGIAPGPHVWFIGDSHTDMQCAHNAGCTPVLIETKAPPPEMLKNCPPAHRFRRHIEIMEYITADFTR